MKSTLIIVIGLFSITTIFGQEKYSPVAKQLFDEGISAYQSNNFDAAISKFTGAIAIEETFAEAYLNRSIVYSKTSAFELAFSDAKKAYHLDKEQDAVFSQLGKTYYKQNHIDSAQYFLSKGVNAKTVSDEDLYFLANVEADLEDYNNAVQTYTDLLMNLPKNSTILNQRGIVYFKMGEYSKSEEDFLRALEHEPNNISIYSNLANAAIEANDTSKAIQYLNRGVNKATGKTKIEFLILNGNYNFKLGNMEEAKKYFDQAYELDKKNPVILVNQASVLIEVRDYESAINKCSKAIEEDPEFMPAFFNRGIAYEMVKNTADACVDWEEAFILGSTIAEEYLNSATCSE